MLMTSFLVIKIGGSLLTKKSGSLDINLNAIHNYGIELARQIKQHDGGIVLILGGGSIGNAIPRIHNLGFPGLDVPAVLIPEMTIGMMKWLITVAEIWNHEYGIPCFPLQSAGFVERLDYGKHCTFVKPIAGLIKRGLVPLIAGDSVFDKNGKFEILSSDFIPYLLAKRISIKRVVMLTDVPGLLVHRNNKSCSKLMSRVTQTSANYAIEISGPSSNPDVTGGMRTKVKALLKLAELGVKGVIMDGREVKNLWAVFDEECPLGTVFEPWENISQ